MRHTLLTLSILLTAMATQAAPITLEKARENATAFLTSGSMQQRVKGNRSLKLAYTRNDTKGAPLFHVFNIGDGGGFVIASADDVAVPVLGYCDKGAFGPDDIPVNMQAWLDGYSEEIGKARENGVVAKGDAPVYASRKKIDPMIKSTWDQDAPYNDMCIFDGNCCATGCVATGMAQIMYYWATTGIDGKRFRCGSTALPAYITSTQRYSVGALDALASFDWDSMTDGMPTTTKGKTAVAQLMRYCGQSVKTDFKEESASATLEDAAKALQDNFDYNWSMQVVYSHNMTEEEWQELVYNELAEGKPFFMSGLGTGGHAFICDGYDPANGEFHFNWGWGGGYNGWFAMTSLIPGICDFSYRRWGIKGIQPFSASLYAVLSTDGKTLSFYCDDKRKKRTGTLFRLNSWSFFPSWRDDTDVEHVFFDSSFSEARPTSTTRWFKGMTLLKDITGLSYLNTSEVTDMWGMFYDCESLENIDVSHFDTSNVTNMWGMFYDCESLENLDVSHFDTSKVTDMGYMFKTCRSLKQLDVSHFDTSKVTDMENMFGSCFKLESLDVSHFNMSKVTDASMIFYFCSSLLDLYIPATLPKLDGVACMRVGTNASPCRLHAPTGFDFGFTPPANEAFKWKNGWFILSEVYDVFAIGDVNHDEQVSITDVTLMVDHVLGGQPKVFYEENADMNNDGQINITDVTLLVKATLGT